MSPRPERRLTLYLLIHGALCLGLTGAQEKQNASLFQGDPHEIGSVRGQQKQNGEPPTSGSRLSLGDLDEADINKLLPYEVVENTDVPERQLIPEDIFYKYYVTKNKTNDKPFTLLDKLTSKVLRNKRSDAHLSVGKTPQFRQQNVKHVPKMLRYFKEAKKNFTQEREQFSHRFGGNVNTFTSGSAVARDNIWAPVFADLKKDIPLDDKFPVLQAAPPSNGYPWPLPQKLTTNPDHVFNIDISQFQFTLSPNSYDCDILQAGLGRYIKRLIGLTPLSATNDSTLRDTQRLAHLSGIGPDVVIQKLEITIRSPCNRYPALESDESYDLVVDETSAALKAVEVWGALRGIHTFSQMIYVCHHMKLCINKTSITDYPRFKHRGIMLDTSRHYISPEILKKNMDVMEMNKLNVLHWHIVDDQSFPFVSLQFPNLSAKGAFNPRETYDHAVIKELIEYSRLRGIRIVPEFDTPGHVRSWGAGYPEILTDCGLEGMGPIDPSKNITFHFLSRLFSEVMDLFPDKTLHLGGDECPYHCWKRSPKMLTFMLERGFGGDFTMLEEYYINRLLLSLNQLKKSKGFVFWQDILDNNIKIPRNTTIQIWKDFGGSDIRALQKASEMGLRTIYSSAWYLNYISYGKDWVKYYTVEPTEHLWTDEAKQLIIGGEACLWGEYIDDNNLLQTLWPRASAVAERLWSASHVTNATQAEPRFEEHRCRMIRLDVPASPNGGPGSCNKVPAF